MTLNLDHYFVSEKRDSDMKMILTRGNPLYSSGRCIVKLLYQIKSMWIMKVEKLILPITRKNLQEKKDVKRAVDVEEKKT